MAKQTKTTGPRREHGTAWKRSLPLRHVLHYLNAQPTEQSWKNVVLGLRRREVLGSGEWPRDLPVYGVQSFAECMDILERFRAFVTSFIALKSPTSIEAIRLAETLAERANRVPDRLGFDPRTLRLVQRWKTEKASFAEALYAWLVFALQDVPYPWIHRCKNCQTFFASESKREIKYCSPRCRNQALVRRHRQRLAQPQSQTKRPRPTRRAQPPESQP